MHSSKDIPVSNIVAGFEQEEAEGREASQEAGRIVQVEDSEGLDWGSGGREERGGTPETFLTRRCEDFSSR